MLDFLRTQRSPVRPSPEEAFEALAASRCMYATVNACSGPLRSVGLRGDDDGSAVLVCKAHFGRLRRLDEQAAEAYRRHLERAFAAMRPPRDEPEPDEPEVSWPRVMSR